eukprot:scaffold3003_cov279-Pinguiococcus_pyrenoidosus.AAC.2
MPCLHTTAHGVQVSNASWYVCSELDHVCLGRGGRLGLTFIACAPADGRADPRGDLSTSKNVIKRSLVASVAISSSFGRFAARSSLARRLATPLVALSWDQRP